MAGLEQALAGTGEASSKRKNISSSSEDWGEYSMYLYNSNQLPGTLAKKNIRKAQKAGANGIKLKGKKGTKNASRTLRRAQIKTLWPKPYWAAVPMRCPKTKQEKQIMLCFHLPHEWLATFLADKRAVAACQPRKGSKIKHAWDKILKDLKDLGMPLPERGTVPLGLHGDAVPFQGTMRQQSLDYLTINLPSNAQLTSLGVPFTVINTKFHSGYKTKEAILNILLWSLECLKKGEYPSARHDGTAWWKSDKHRALLQGSLPARGILCEVRGDWAWLNSWFNLPTWNTASGLCCLCKATYGDFKSQTAHERQDMLSKAEFVHRVVDMGKTLCPLWAWPEMTPQVMILPDWLHAVDQGIGSDIAGQLLLELARKQAGASLREKVATIWKEIQGLYKEYNIEYRFVNLTPEILGKGKNKSDSTATLKGPAAHVRHLMPLLPILTAKYFKGGTTHELACDKLAYGAMETNSLPDMAKYGAKVAAQYIALEREAEHLNPACKEWKIMPKLHQFMHIMEAGFPPQEYWCYADETAGGLFQRLYQRKGGKERPGTCCEIMLSRWQQVTHFPSIPLRG